VKAAALTLAAVLLWGLSPVGTRDLVGMDHAALPALPFIGMRYLVATLFFLAPLRRALASWSRADLGAGLLCGLLGITGYNLLNALGTRTVSAGMVGLLDGAEPLLIVLLGALWHRRLPGLATVAAALVGVVGVIILTLGAGPALVDNGWGIVWILLSAVCWSLYCVIVPPLMERRGAMDVTSVTVAFGTIPMLLAGLPQMQSMVMQMDRGEWALLIALSVATSVVALLCWNIGAARLGAEKAGYFLYFIPFVSVLGGAAYLAEPITPAECAGGALVLLAVYVSQRGKSA
jgi:drug/metabolite transporter (DMT)-like permease